MGCELFCGAAMDQLLNPQWWQEVIATAPWPWVISSLLLGFLVGWKSKGAIDDGEIRELRAHREFVHEKYDTVVNRENELTDKVARQDKVIAELQKTGIAPARVVELSTSNTEIKNALTNLSTSTSNLGEALNFIPGSAQATLTSASPSVEIKPTIPPRFNQR
jgi:hypothetical protein